MARVFAHGAVEELPPVHAADQLARSEFFLAVFQDPFFGFLKIPLHLLHQLLRRWKGGKTNTNIVNWSSVGRKRLMQNRVVISYFSMMAKLIGREILSCHPRPKQHVQKVNIVLRSSREEFFNIET
jgi:hypothetical protein